MAHPAAPPIPPVLPAPPKLCVVPHSDSLLRIEAARACAEILGVPLHQPDAIPDEYDTALMVTDRRLELRVLRGDDSLIGGHGVASELTSLDTTSGPGRSLGQPVLKAIGIKRRNPYRPTVFDATAGLGEDTWLMASMGCTVSACERNPITHALLSDGLRRAYETDPDTADRVTLNQGDGVAGLNDLAASPPAERPDVVYLDPMFPLGRKTAERKAMRVLRLISGDDPDASELLEAALRTATKRVVVKRPRLAPALPGPAPGVVHKGKSLRFDVYPVSAK